MADFDAAGLLAFGDQKEQPGADLNAAWYLRNAKIFAKQHLKARPLLRIRYGSVSEFQPFNSCTPSGCATSRSKRPG